MEDDVSCNENANQHQDTQVAPVATRYDFARGDDRECREKGDVDQRCRENSEIGRKENCNAARKPERGQRHQRRTGDRQPAGPVRNCSEQKASNYCRDIAVEHFMDVPIERRIGGAQ